MNQIFSFKFIYGLFLMSFIVIFKNSFTQTNIAGGNIFGIWTVSGSPYLINGHVFIPTDSTLTIEPGVDVLFQNHYKLNIQGRLLAIGNNIDSIYFGVSPSQISTGWWGLRFELTSVSQDSSILDYCTIKYGKANASNEDGNGGGIFLKNFSSVRISNCLITNNIALSGNTLYGHGGGIYCKNSSPIIRNNSIINNNAQWRGGGIACEFSSPLIINNIIRNNINSSGAHGGAISCKNSAPHISNNIMTYNTANNGGAIHLSSSSPTISDNLISNNTCQGSGGGIYVWQNSYPTIIDNDINFNNAGVGGGIYSNGSLSIIESNNIENNTAENGGGIASNWNDNSEIINNVISFNSAFTSVGVGGGGIACFNGSIKEIKNNIISNNNGYVGGGIFCSQSSPDIINNLICNNSCIENGGGIYLQHNSSPKIINCSISNNESTTGPSAIGPTYGGGGIYCFVDCNPSITNSILYGNNAIGNNGHQLYLSDNGSDPSFSHCNIEGGSLGFFTNGSVYSGTYINNINNTPNYVLPTSGLGHLFNGVNANWKLQNTSLCIDAGTPNIFGLNLPNTDLAGTNRVIGTAVDIGAYEYDICVQVSIDTFVTQLGNVLTAVENGASYQWINCSNMNPIPGAINQSYSASTIGDYAVIITKNGCSKTSACTTVTCTQEFSTDVKTACDSFVWIDGNTYFSNNNTATFLYPAGSINGCDSSVTLDLTINNINTSVTQIGATLTADESGANYQWLDCSDMTQIDSSTSQTYSTLNDGSYAVVIVKNDCIDTSSCYSVSSIGIIENIFDDEIIIYPNPTNGQFSINLGSKYARITLSILDVSGKHLFTKIFYKSQLLNVILTEPSGVYLVKITTEENKKALIRIKKE